MSDLNITLQASTDTFASTSAALFNVKALAPSGKTYTIAADTNAYITLVTKENSVTVTRYATIAGPLTINSTQAQDLGFFHSDYTPSSTAGDTTASIYNITETSS